MNQQSEQQDNGGLPGDFWEQIAKSDRTKDCIQCQRQFNTHVDADLCQESQYYKDNPPEAPKYWTWTKRHSGVWGIRAAWPETDPLPEPGDQVTVNRKNGTTSVETIREVEGLRYQMDGRAVLECFIQ